MRGGIGQGPVSSSHCATLPQVALFLCEALPPHQTHFCVIWLFGFSGLKHTQSNLRPIPLHGYNSLVQKLLFADADNLH